MAKANHDYSYLRKQSLATTGSVGSTENRKYTGSRKQTRSQISSYKQDYSKLRDNDFINIDNI